MATKKYIGTTYLGGTGGAGGVYNNNSGQITNGEVRYNIRNQGGGDSRGAYSPNTGVAGAKTTTAKTSGSKTGTATASASAASSNTGDAYNALLAAYASKQNDYSDYLRQMREAAQNAYDRGMSALNNAYDNQLTSLKDNLSETTGQLENQYNRSKTSINQDAESSLRQAYINKMMSQKNLGQQMSAQGLTGGATETSLASMLNNYNNARNNINTTTNNNLYNLEGNYSDNLSQARQAYNSAVASANLQKAQQAMQLENALANNQISALGDYQSLMQRENQNYLDLLKAAIANGASFSYDPTQANNTFRAVNVQQAANPTLESNYQAVQELMNSQDLPGTSSPGVTYVNTPATGNYLADILAKLRR
jgi:hypothetical protein